MDGSPHVLLLTGTYSINTQQGGADGSIMYEMSDTASTFLTNCYNNILVSSKVVLQIQCVPARLAGEAMLMLGHRLICGHHVSPTVNRS
jgi:hypothetical protein